MAAGGVKYGAWPAGALSVGSCQIDYTQGAVKSSGANAALKRRHRMILMNMTRGVIDGKNSLEKIWRKS